MSSLAGGGQDLLCGEKNFPHTSHRGVRSVSFVIKFQNLFPCSTSIVFRCTTPWRGEPSSTRPFAFWASPPAGQHEVRPKMQLQSRLGD